MFRGKRIIRVTPELMRLFELRSELIVQNNLAHNLVEFLTNSSLMKMFTKCNGINLSLHGKNIAIFNQEILFSF